MANANVSSVASSISFPDSSNAESSNFFAMKQTNSNSINVIQLSGNGNGVGVDNCEVESDLLLKQVLLWQYLWF